VVTEADRLSARDLPMRLRSMEQSKWPAALLSPKSPGIMKRFHCLEAISAIVGNRVVVTKSGRTGRQGQKVRRGDANLYQAADRQRPGCP